jgi:hypothetical protein
LLFHNLNLIVKIIETLEVLALATKKE